ncbi:hypothetical protein PMAYCL1PPCAC_26223, partial [Pristionchus mayeri]
SLFSGMWTGASANCLLLVTNRLFELLNFSHFTLKRTMMYLVITSFYIFFFMFFTPTHVTNSKEKGMFFDPFIRNDTDVKFANFPHTANNLIVVMATAVLYISLCIVLVVKQSASKMILNLSVFRVREIPPRHYTVAELYHNAAKQMSKLNRYVYMNFFEVPAIFVEFGHLNWQLSHGIFK